MVKLYSLLASIFIAMSSFGQAPDFQAIDHQGNEFSLYADYLDQGTTVVVEFFFVNCLSCAESAPLLEQMYQDWGAGQNGVEFMSISHQDTNDQLAQFAADFGVTFPLVGASGNGFAISEMYNSGEFGDFYSYPTYVIIAPDGTMAYNPVEDDLETLVAIHQNLLEITENGTVSIKPHDELLLEYYPNPVIDAMTVTTSIPSRVEIKAITGEIVHSEAIETTSKIDCNHLEAGIYFIQATQGDRTFTSKFFKK